MAVVILADQPELVALGTLSGVAPSRMAAAFNDADHFFTHLTLDELIRVQGACERLGSLSSLLAASLQEYAQAVREAVAASVEASDAD